MGGPGQSRLRRVKDGREDFSSSSAQSPFSAENTNVCTTETLAKVDLTIGFLRETRRGVGGRKKAVRI